TALGDTLFPKTELHDDGLVAHITEDLSATEHFLVRLRIVHPIVAVCAALFVVIYTSLIRLDGARGRTRYWSSVVTAMVLLQTVLGVVNVLLKAPGWMQLVHLLVAVTLWVSAVFLLFAALARPEELASADETESDDALAAST